MQTIEITTSQNVTIEYELAGLRERFFARLIDSIIIGFIWIALLIILATTTLIRSELVQQMIGVFPFWFIIIYDLLCDLFLGGQTFGKRTQRTKVVRLDGKPTSMGDYLIRSVLLLVDYPFTVGVIGALLISTSQYHQRLGDMAANVTVIKIGTDRRFSLSDILNINTLDNYTPQYPQVRQLSEDDMLFIKNVILRFQKYRNTAHEEAVDAHYDQLKKVLDVRLDAQYTTEKLDFFKILIKDYIVLTR